MFAAGDFSTAAFTFRIAWDIACKNFKMIVQYFFSDNQFLRFVVGLFQAVALHKPIHTGFHV